MFIWKSTSWMRGKVIARHVAGVYRGSPSPANRFRSRQAYAASFEVGRALPAAVRVAAHAGSSGACKAEA